MRFSTLNQALAAALNTPGFKPFTLELDVMSEGTAIQLWGALAGGTEPQRREVERFAGAAALAKFDDHLELGLSEGLYPIWDSLDDMLLAQGVIEKG